MTYFVNPQFNKALAEHFMTPVADILGSLQKTAATFPPYNVRNIGENKYAIEIAAAGYDIGSFEITLDKDVLHVKCAGNATDKMGEYLYRGLTNKPWVRDFVLNTGVTVLGASMINGLLKVELERLIPENQKPRKIDIKNPTAESHPHLLNEDSNF